MKITHIWIVFDAMPIDTMATICRKVDLLTLYKLQDTFNEPAGWKIRGARFFTSEGEAKHEAKAALDLTMKYYYADMAKKGLSKPEADRHIADMRRKLRKS